MIKNETFDEVDENLYLSDTLAKDVMNKASVKEI